MQHINREAAVGLLIPAGALKQIPVLTLEWFSPCFSRAAPLAKIPLKELEQHPRNSHSSLGGSRSTQDQYSQQEFPAAEAWLGLELRRGRFAGPLE